MQRRLTVFISLFLIYLLTACFSNKTDTPANDSPSSDTINLLTLEDGIYFAKEDHFCDEGWKNIVSFEILDNQMINLSFDAVHELAASTKKTLAVAEVYIDSEDSLNALSWDRQIELLESHMLNQETLDDILLLADNEADSIPDLTIEIEPFIELITVAIETGPIEMGPYLDGFYFAEQEEFVDGFKYFARLIVENGYIIAVHWNGLHEDGVRLITDLNLEEIDDTWRDQVERLEKYLLDIQNPMDITFDDENKTEAVFGVSIEINDFIELAVQALANGPLLNEES